MLHKNTKDIIEVINEFFDQKAQTKTIYKKYECIFTNDSKNKKLNENHAIIELTSFCQTPDHNIWKYLITLPLDMQHLSINNPLFDLSSALKAWLNNPLSPNICANISIDPSRGAIGLDFVEIIVEQESIGSPRTPKITQIPQEIGSK